MLSLTSDEFKDERDVILILILIGKSGNSEKTSSVKLSRFEQNDYPNII
jgi:hypothetical protein